MKFQKYSKGGFLAFALISGSMLFTVKADSITGSVIAAPSTVNLNLSSAYSYYGGSPDVANTDSTNLAQFSDITATGEFTGLGTDSSSNLTTYNNGITSASDSPNYSLAQIRGNDSGTATLSLSTILFAPTETFSLYMSDYDTTGDLSVTSSGGGSLVLTNQILPTSSDTVNGTGDGHTYGVFDFTVSGTVGDTLTISDSTDQTGVITGNGYYTVGINAITANVVPEPTAWLMLLCGIVLLATVRRYISKSKFSY